MIRGLTHRRLCAGATWPSRSGPHQENEAVKKVIERTGILEGRHRRAVDSMILVDAVATKEHRHSAALGEPPRWPGRCLGRRGSRQRLPSIIAPGRVGRRAA